MMRQIAFIEKIGWDYNNGTNFIISSNATIAYQLAVAFVRQIT